MTFPDLGHIRLRAGGRVRCGTYNSVRALKGLALVRFGVQVGYRAHNLASPRAHQNPEALLDLGFKAPGV